MKPNQSKKLRGPRLLLIILGIVFIAIATYILFQPQYSPDHAASICFSLGVILVLLGLFASERIVKILESILTGW